MLRRASRQGGNGGGGGGGGDGDALLARMALRRLLLAAALGLSFAAAFELSDNIVYAPSNEGLRPQSFTAFNRTHYYQVPEQPRGTLVVFHGCGRAARAFFPYDPEHCAECLGAWASGTVSPGLPGCCRCIKACCVVGLRPRLLSA